MPNFQSLILVSPCCSFGTLFYNTHQGVETRKFCGVSKHPKFSTKYLRGNNVMPRYIPQGQGCCWDFTNPPTYNQQGLHTDPILWLIVSLTYPMSHPPIWEIWWKWHPCCLENLTAKNPPIWEAHTRTNNVLCTPPPLHRAYNTHNILVIGHNLVVLLIFRLINRL